MENNEELIKMMDFLGLSSEEKKKMLNSWVGQEKGPINTFKKHHKGTQPIRVNQNMLEYMFHTTYPTFQEKLKELVRSGKFNPNMDLKLAEEAIGMGENKNTPRVSSTTRQISLHETFLSYLWCISYSVYILYIEKVDYPTINKNVGYEQYPVSEEEIAMAYDVFDYGRSLIAHFTPWDKEKLPNPKRYLAEKRNYVEQTNMCYTEAAKFILAHELTHLESHLDLLDKNTPDSNYLAFEKEADQKAIEHVLRGIPQIGPIAASSGIIIGLLSMFYFSATTTGKRHPNSEDRLTSALELMNKDSNDFTWGMACVGLELWDSQFGIQLNWLKSPESSQQQYYHIINQIKARS